MFRGGKVGAWKQRVIHLIFNLKYSVITVFKILIWRITCIPLLNLIVVKWNRESNNWQYAISSAPLWDAYKPLHLGEDGLGNPFGFVRTGSALSICIILWWYFA